MDSILSSSICRNIPTNTFLGGALAVIVLLILFNRIKTIVVNTLMTLSEVSVKNPVNITVNITAEFVLGYFSYMLGVAFFLTGLLVSVIPLWYERSECDEMADFRMVAGLCAYDIGISCIRSIRVYSKDGVVAPKDRAVIPTTKVLNCVRFVAINIIYTLLPTPYTPPYFLVSTCLAFNVGDSFMQ